MATSAITTITPDDAWVVGSNAVTTTLAAHWDDTSWTIVPTPSPLDGPNPVDGTRPKVAANHYGRAAGLRPASDLGRPAILVKCGRANFERGQLARAEHLFREAIAAYETRHDAAAPARRRPDWPS